MSEKTASLLMGMALVALVVAGFILAANTVVDVLRQQPDVMPATPNVGAPDHSQPSARPFPWVQPGNEPNNGPSYPDRRPADRIDGETILNVSHDRVRDRSPP